MADFIWIQHDEAAINMDHVLMVNYIEETGMVALEMSSGDTKILKGNEALRVMAWLRNKAGLPVLGPQAGGGS